MSKIYVEIIAKFTKEGQIIPQKLIWRNGMTYSVTKVIDVRRAASLRAGGAGIRYTCIIEGQERYLFMEDIEFNKVAGCRWFTESKDET